MSRERRGMLQDLESLCKQFGSSKVKERKESLSNMKDYVKQRASHGDLSKIEPKTWEKTIGIILEHVENETATQMRQKTANPRRDISEPFKDLIVQLVQSDVHLTTKTVKALYKYLIESFKNEAINAIYCIDHAEILRSLLNHRVYALKLEPQMFSDLFDLFCDFIVSRPNRNKLPSAAATESLPYINTLATLLSQYPRDIAGKQKDILDFFEKLFTSKNDFPSSERAQLALLSSLNEFLRTNALNMVYSVRSLGENLCDMMLNIWKTSKHDLLMVEVLQFLRIQVRINHSQEEGDVPNKAILTQIYSVLVDTLNTDPASSSPLARTFVFKSLRDQTKLVARDQPAISLQMKIFFDLVADVFYQMHHYFSASADSTDGTTNQAKKRRRLLSVDEQITNKLTEANIHDDNLMLWVRVTLVLLEKYPAMGQTPFFAQLLDPLKRILERCSNEAILAVVVRVLDKFATITKKVMETASTSAYWESIWSVLCKLLEIESTRRANTELVSALFALMSSLCMYSLVPSSTVIASQNTIFDSKFFKETEPFSMDSVKFLLVYACRYRFQEYNKERTVLRRELVLRWLFSNMKSETQPWIVDSSLIGAAIVAIIRPGEVLSRRRQTTPVENANESDGLINNVVANDSSESSIHKDYEQKEIALHTLTKFASPFKFEPYEGAQQRHLRQLSELFQELETNKSDLMLAGELTAPHQVLVTARQGLISQLRDHFEFVTTKEFSPQKSTTKGGHVNQFTLKVGHALRFAQILCDASAWYHNGVDQQPNRDESAQAISDYLCKCLQFVCDRMYELVPGSDFDSWKAFLKCLRNFLAAVPPDQPMLPSLQSKYQQCWDKIAERIAATMKELQLDVVNSDSQSSAATPSKDDFDMASQNDDLLLMDIDEEVKPKESKSNGKKSTAKKSPKTLEKIKTTLLSVIPMLYNRFSTSDNVTQPLLSELISWLEATGVTHYQTKLEICYCLSLLRNTPTRVKFQVLEALAEIINAPELTGDDQTRVNVLRIAEQIASSLHASALDTEDLVNDDDEEFDRSRGDRNNDQILEVVDASLLTKFDALFQKRVLNWHTRLALARCIQCYLELDSEKFAKYISVFLSMVDDFHYNVREYIARKSAIFMDIFEARYSIFLDILAVLDPLLNVREPPEESEPHSDEIYLKARTAVICMAHIACKAWEVEQHAIYHLLMLSSRGFIQKHFVPATLEFVASSLGYEDGVVVFLEDHLRFFLFKWFNQGFDVKDFPCEYFVSDVEDSDEEIRARFLRDYGSYVWPYVIWKRKDATVRFISQVLGKDEKDLIKSNFATIFAFNFLLYYTDAATAKKVVEEYLPEKLGKDKEIDAQISGNLDMILVEMLNISRPVEKQKKSDEKNDSTGVTLPFFEESCVKEAVDKLADNFKKKDAPELFTAKGDRVHNILLALYEQAVNTHRTNLRLQGFEVFKFFVSLLEYQACTPSVLRTTIHLVLQLISFPELRNESCDLLLDIYNRVIENEAEVQFGKHMKKIISSLISVVLDSQSSSHALRALEQIVLNAPEELSEFVSELDPFPDKPTFSRFETRRQSLRADKEHSVLTEISRFLKSVGYSSDGITDPILGTVDSSTILLGITQLTRQIKEQKSEFLTKLGNHDEYKDNVAKLMHKLIVICNGQYDEDIKLAVGECLGELGLTASGFISSSKVFSMEMNNEFEFENIKIADGEWSVEAVHREAHKMILKLLNRYLIDRDVILMRGAAENIRAILQTPSGRRAYELLDDDTKLYLEPFTISSSSSRAKAKATKKDKATDVARLDSNELWATKGKTHADWISSVLNSLIAHGTSPACGMMTDEVFKLCSGDILARKAEFAEQLFPYVLFNLATNSSATKSTQQQLCSLLSEKLVTHIIGSDAVPPDDRTVRLVISSLNLIRRHRKELYKSAATASSVANASKTAKGPGAWQTDYWLEIPYLDLARAALRVNANFTTLLYTEANCEKSNVLEVLSSNIYFEDVAPEHQKLFLDAYKNIDEPDGIYGVNTNYGIRSLTRQYEHEGNWEKSLGSYDTILQSRQDAYTLAAVHDHLGLLNSLQHLGYTNSIRCYLGGVSSTLVNDSQLLQELQYESAWRACQLGSDTVDTESKQGENRFHVSVHKCLRSLLQGDGLSFWDTYKQARLKVVANLGSAKNLYPNLAKLQMLSELASAWTLRWSPDATSSKQLASAHVPSTDEMRQHINQRWKVIGPDTPFEYFEPVLALRSSLISVLMARHTDDMNNDDALQHLAGYLCWTAGLARKAARFNMASSMIQRVSSSAQVISSSASQGRSMALINPAALLEEAKILWKHGEAGSAIKTARFLLSNIANRREDAPLYAKALTMTGKWLGQTHTESSQTIMNDYLQKSVAVSEAYNAQKNQHPYKGNAKGYFTLARYLDNLYDDYLRKQKSEDWVAAQQLRDQNKKLLIEYTEFLKTSKDASVNREIERQIRELTKHAEIDKQETQKLVADANKYLLAAIENYGKCAKSGDKYDLNVVFRMVSLWFNHSESETVNKMFYQSSKDISSHKFIPLMYQIASRLGSQSDNKPFANVLNYLVERIARHHPYHSLYQIFALAKGDQFPVNQRGKEHFEVDKGRIEAANNIILKLRNSSSASGSSSGKKKTEPASPVPALDLPEIVKQVEQLITAYIQLAFNALDPKQYKNVTKPVPLSERFLIRQIRNLDKVPVATLELPVSPSGVYDSFESVVGFEESFTLCGGINLPKIVKCIGSSGRKYRQLVKGIDDLRQDAVMQQIFILVNGLLAQDPDTRKRGLRVRTYKVIPMTPTTGIIGWVENTIPLAEYLVGSHTMEGAHSRYRPTDWSNAECRKRLALQTVPDKLPDTFNEICAKFKPVFHHFFLENFPDHTEWFLKRLNYTRSVASNSIVGYIIGLGDRHSSNILIDRQTAEVVHIDLGVAFEQGKLLPTPERVPFRLTRDIVDGFGVSGCEGVFRRCSEAMLRVLRANTELLHTIVEVFIHDPLYRWAVSPMKALRVQRLHGGDRAAAEGEGEGEGEEEGGAESNVINAMGGKLTAAVAADASSNRDARRALLRIKEKLQGYEEGEFLSVEGQVNMLINQARNADALSRMFPGWAPWL